MTLLRAKTVWLILPVLFFITGAWADDVPVPFIVNKGQCDRAVQFYARTFGGSVFVDDGGEIRYLLHLTDAADRTDLTVSEQFLTRTKPSMHGEGQAVTNIGFFKDCGLSQWKSYVPTYDLIDIDSVCSGVSVSLLAYENSFEKRFEIGAGSDPGELGFRVEPAKGLAVTSSGDLTVETEAGLVCFTKPVAVQIDGGRTKYVDIAYVLSGDQYHFALGSRDPLLPTTIITRTRVIEPAESME